MRDKRYEIYDTVTGEVYTWGYSSFTAICNLSSLKRQHGEDNVSIRWVG